MKAITVTSTDFPCPGQPARRKGSKWPLIFRSPLSLLALLGVLVTHVLLWDLSELLTLSPVLLLQVVPLPHPSKSLISFFTEEEDQMMASSFVCTRSLISAQRLLNSSGIRRFLSLRNFIALENRSCSWFRQQSPLLLLSRSNGLRQTLLCRSSSAAGIVKSEYTVEIPEISVSDFVLSKFKEYGDDIAMVSYREAMTAKHTTAIIY